MRIVTKMEGLNRMSNDCGAELLVGKPTIASHKNHILVMMNGYEVARFDTLNDETIDELWKMGFQFYYEPNLEKSNYLKTDEVMEMLENEKETDFVLGEREYCLALDKADGRYYISHSDGSFITLGTKYFKKSDACKWCVLLNNSLDFEVYGEK